MVPIRLAPVPRLLSKVLLSLLALVVLLVSLVFYVAVAGIAIDAGPYRTPLQTMLSEQLGHQVHLEGALGLQIS